MNRNPTFCGAWLSGLFLTHPPPHITLPPRHRSDGYVSDFAIDSPTPNL